MVAFRLAAVPPEKPPLMLRTRPFTRGAFSANGSVSSLTIPGSRAAAARSGARIVFSCGFDSIPFDLGVLTLQEARPAELLPRRRASRGRVSPRG